MVFRLPTFRRRLDFPIRKEDAMRRFLLRCLYSYTRAVNFVRRVAASEAWLRDIF